MESKKLLILVATMTGTALMAAEDIAEYCSENDIETKIIEIDNTDIKVLTEVKSPVLICSSTYGQGDVPDSAQNFYNKLKELSPNLNHIRYALFGLGDMTYRDTFAYGGKKFTDLLDSLNATKIGDPFYHDASDGTLPEEVAVDWFVNNIKEYI
ncbi:MAG: flavodoxin domain-containing protein [Alphaproteobacteria bacterium]|nr:flavodoxin domain-containing protein [Alphaproteobacteria bacterium]